MGFLVVVGHIDGGGAQAAQQRADLGAERLAQVAVQVGQRLIEQQQARAADDGAGQRDALLLAAGQLGRAAPGQRFQPDQRQRLGHPPGPLAPWHAAHFQRKADVLRHAHVRP